MEPVNPAAALPWARPAGQLIGVPAEDLHIHVRKQVLGECRPPAEVTAEAMALLPRLPRAAADVDVSMRFGLQADYRLLHAEMLAGVAEFYEQDMRFTPYVATALEYAGSAVVFSTAAMDLGCEEPEERAAAAAAADMEARYATLIALGSRLDRLAGGVARPPPLAHAARAAEAADAEADAADASLAAAMDAALRPDGGAAAAAAVEEDADEEEAAEAHMQVAAAAIVAAADAMLAGARPFYTTAEEDGRDAVTAAVAAAVATSYVALARHNLQGHGLPRAAARPAARPAARAAAPAAVRPASSSSSSSSSCCRRL